MATPRQVAVACARACDETKATDVVVLHVEELTSVALYFVICTTRHPRQTRAVIDAAADAAAALGEKENGREGVDEGEWAVVDFVDVVVHAFSSDHRGFYDIESAWSDAPKVRWQKAPAAAKLRAR